MLQRESDLGNTQKSRNVEIIKEVYFAENKLHEIRLSTKRRYQDVKANPDDANSEKRMPEERHVKTETIISSMVSDTLSEKKGRPTTFHFLSSNSFNSTAPFNSIS